MEKPIFKNILQVGLVVKDLETAVRKYWDEFGIGPWAIFTFDEESIPNLKVRGKETACRFKVAFTNVGSVQLELIEPLDDNSIYSEFLKEKGEGLHHLACDISNSFDETVGFCKEKGAGILQSGEGFAYLDTRSDLSYITEIYGSLDLMDNLVPEAIYPPDAGIPVPPKSS